LGLNRSNWNRCVTERCRNIIKTISHNSFFPLQDTAKSTHYANHSESHTLIDLNRAGSALVEIVSGPDMRTAEQAGAYVRKLRETIRRIGVSDGNMDQGSLRCDVNVSINRKGEPWGTRCEVKNLNSIRFVMNAIGE
jgi:aspartyl-tRNA(Asn)/glutamyl-tRNA(Gln) amidotransferase subunit B